MSIDATCECEVRVQPPVSCLFKLVLLRLYYIYILVCVVLYNTVVGYITFLYVVYTCWSSKCWFWCVGVSVCVCRFSYELACMYVLIVCSCCHLLLTYTYIYMMSKCEHMYTFTIRPYAFLLCSKYTDEMQKVCKRDQQTNNTKKEQMDDRANALTHIHTLAIEE